MSNIYCIIFWCRRASKCFTLRLCILIERAAEGHMHEAVSSWAPLRTRTTPYQGAPFRESMYMLHLYQNLYMFRVHAMQSLRTHCKLLLWCYIVNLNFEYLKSTGRIFTCCVRVRRLLFLVLRLKLAVIPLKHRTQQFHRLKQQHCNKKETIENWKSLIICANSLIFMNWNYKFWVECTCGSHSRMRMTVCWRIRCFPINSNFIFNFHS